MFGHREREGQLIDRSLMKNVLQMLVEIGTHGAHDSNDSGGNSYSLFEAQFLSETSTFYTTESQNYLTKNSCPDYVRKAELRLNEESSR